MIRHTTLPAPVRPANVPPDAHWLAGEGAGSWFVLRWSGDLLLVERLSPIGNTECLGTFTLVGTAFPDRSTSLEVTFPTHCALITLRQRGECFTYRRSN